MGRGKAWSPEESAALAKAYRRAGGSQTKGASMRQESYEKRLHSAFKKECKGKRNKEQRRRDKEDGKWSSRSRSACTKQWNKIKAELGKFNESLSLVYASLTTGNMSNDEYINAAVAIHLNETGVPRYTDKNYNRKNWILSQAYDVVKDMPKFKHGYDSSVGRKRSKAPSAPSSGSSFSGDDDDDDASDDATASSGGDPRRRNRRTGHLEHRSNNSGDEAKKKKMSKKRKEKRTSTAKKKLKSPGRRPHGRDAARAKKAEKASRRARTIADKRKIELANRMIALSKDRAEASKINSYFQAYMAAKQEGDEARAKRWYNLYQDGMTAREEKERAKVSATGAKKQSAERDSDESGGSESDEVVEVAAELVNSSSDVSMTSSSKSSGKESSSDEEDTDSQATETE